MGYKFTVTQIIEGYSRVDDEYKKVVTTQDFECNTFDDLQNLIMMMVDFSRKNVKFEIHKEEVEDVPMP